MIWWSIILGATQGITELLPVSSSAHLIILPWLFHLPDPGLTFDVALHFGTVLAVIIYFAKDIWKLLKALGRSFYARKIDQPEERLIWFIIVASVPAAIFGFLFDKKAETVLRAPLLIAGTLAIFGVILYVVDVYCAKGRSLQKMTFPESLFVGIAQALAIVPGVSRSGATITATRLLKFNRLETAKFSFLLAVPVLLGAFIFEVIGLHGAAASQFYSWPTLLGTLSAFLFGLLAIKFLMSYLKKGSFVPFVIYRLALAILIVIVYLIR